MIVLDKMDRSYYTVRDTQHYRYKLQFDIKSLGNKYPNAHIYVGDPLKPCLSLSVPLKDSLDVYRNFDEDSISVAFLNRLENIHTCLLNDVGSANQEQHSFTKEMFNDVMNIIRKNYPHIHHIKFVDTSFIPCGEDDTLELMYYYIAVRSESWYETNFQAYFLPKKKYVAYRCSVDKYSSEETKKSISWGDFYTSYLSYTNDYAKPIINEHIETVKHMYETSLTLPAFLKVMATIVPHSEKCKFFKGWLVSLLERFDIIPLKTWFINLYNVDRKHFTGGRRQTRKQKHKL